MRYDAAIFDLDGTLLDTLEDIADSANAVLRANGYTEHPLQAYKYFVGDGVRKLMERSAQVENLSDDRFNVLLESFRAEYAKRWNVKTRPYDGVAEMLDGCVERGMKIAVLSNKPDESTKACAAELLSRWNFEIVMGARDDLPRKPDPSGALSIARELGCEPERILYLGDSGVDMLTASRAGMFGVGALWGFRSREELERDGARAVLEDPREVLSLLK